MKYKRSVITISFILLAVFVYGLSGFAGGIKERMKTRLPIIIELKGKGIVGENFFGYLEFVGAKKEKPEVVAAENADREKVYAAIAKQQGTTAELVGKRRALQIAQKARPGEWLKDADGNWNQKK
jgi:uncharacterized protein YdbL (DUF1318 family)